MELDKGCPDVDERAPPGPSSLGLVVAATVSYGDFLNGIRGIGEGCSVACSPNTKPMVSNAFIAKSVGDKGDGYLKYGREVYFQVYDLKFLKQF